MATYNRAHLINDTLGSIKNQTYQYFECLIVDDGGQDHTKTVVEEFTSKDKRFSYIVRPDKYKKGLPGCRNYGLDICKGDYVVFFDDDDLVHPDNLLSNLEILKDQKLDFSVYQKQPFIDSPEITESSKPDLIAKVNPHDIINLLENKIPMASCTVFWRESCFKGHRFVEDLSYAEEWELYARMVSSGLCGVMISNVLYFNRKHAESNTGKYYRGDLKMKKAKAQAILALWNHFTQGKLMTFKLKRYLINMSYSFSEFITLNEMLQKSNDLKVVSWFWRIYYVTIPTRLFFYRLRRFKF
jgi:glycosyltransferase involved in cell wall biosynthesis